MGSTIWTCLGLISGFKQVQIMDRLGVYYLNFDRNKYLNIRQVPER